MATRAVEGDEDPALDVRHLTARGAVRGRTPAGGAAQISRLSRELTDHLARDEDAAERAARNAAQQAAVAAAPDRDWLTLPEAARILQLRRGTMRRVIEKHLMPAIQPSGLYGWYHIRGVDLLAYAAQLRLPPDRLAQVHEAVVRLLAPAAPRGPAPGGLWALQPGDRHPIGD